MTRNFLTNAPPFKVEASVKQLGSNLRVARIRRSLTVKQAAESIGTGVRAVLDAEKGKPTTGIAVYTALLWKYQLLDKMADLADPLKDDIGIRLASRKKEPKRVRPHAPEPGVPSVYFIGNRERGVVKIGKSNKPNQRLGGLQSANAEPLTVLAKLFFKTEHAAWTAESELHAKYRHLQIRGEWFRLDSDLEREIQSIPARSAHDKMPS